MRRMWGIAHLAALACTLGGGVGVLAARGLPAPEVAARQAAMAPAAATAAPASAPAPAPAPLPAPAPAPVLVASAARPAAPTTRSAAPVRAVAVRRAPAPTVPAVAPASEAQRGAAALSRIAYPWRDLGYEIVFLGPQRGLFGKTVPAQRRIEIYVRPSEDETLLAHMIAHELGHAVDVTYNDDARRARWRDLRGIGAATPWFGCSRCTDYATPAGDFAETFALWQVGPPEFRSQMAPPPTAEQFDQLRPLFIPST